MTISTNTRRLAAVVAVFAAFLCFAAVAQAQRPAGMSQAEYRALVLRSKALNEKYHLGIWATKPASMSAQAYRALVLRSEALNRKYGLGGSTAKSDSVAPGPGYSSQALRALDDRWAAMTRYYQQAELARARRQAAAFDWDDAGIGALAAILAVALLGLGALRIRSHGEQSASPAAF